MIQELDELISTLEHSINDDANNDVNQPGYIAAFYDKEVDELRKLMEDSKQWIQSYQKELIEVTGIVNLKIKFTGNLGYFIELSHSNKSRVPEFFIPRQELTNSCRYTSEDLRNFESKILNIDGKLQEREKNIFNDLCNSILIQKDYFYDLGITVSFFDFYSNGAYISLQNGYTTPKVKKNTPLEILGGKHPVISKDLRQFISNDLYLEKKDSIHVITGPNMGGKSTFLRQNALIILMSHLGYDISAVHASIPIIDKIFSRVGASDNLYLGQSTFMVEMQEIAYILHHATKESFIIIDEIGRGTSTYDGMSLAWSILEYLHNDLGAKTLFATHYHEIIEHSENLPHSSNWSMSVGEKNGGILFFHKVVSGGVKNSYGIEVAELAGIPKQVIKSARNIMKELEKKEYFTQLSIDENLGVNHENIPESNIKFSDCQEVISFLDNLDLNAISPLDLVQEVIRIKEKIHKY